MSHSISPGGGSARPAGSPPKLLDSVREALRTRHYGALPLLVTGSDLLAIVPLMYARSLLPRYDLRIWELPGRGPSYEVRMLWHDSLTRDPRHRWLRELVRTLFARSPPRR